MATTPITLTITTPTGVSIQNVLDTLTAYWGYQATLANGGANPQTKAQYVQAKAGDFLRQSYIAAKATSDAETARLAAITAASLVTVA